MKKIKYILLALVLGLAGNQLFAMEDPGIAGLQLIDDKLDLYKVGPVYFGSNQPLLSYQDMKYENPNEEIKFEFRYKKDSKYKSVYVRISDGSSWSEWTKLEVGDRLFSTKMIKRLCYSYNINQPQQCFEFQESEKVYIQLTDGNLEAQTGTTPIGGGSILEFMGRKTPQLRGTIRKSFSGLNMHGNIENEEIRFIDIPLQRAQRAKNKACEELKRDKSLFVMDDKMEIWLAGFIEMQKNAFSGDVHAVSVSPRGNYIVVVKEDDTADIYTIRNGVTTKVENDLGQGVSAVYVSRYGSYIVVKRMDKTADIYTIDYSGKAILDNNDLGENIVHVEMSSSEKYIVVIRKDRTADIYTIQRKPGTTLATLADNDLGKVEYMYPTGEYIVVQRRDHTADIYTIKNGRATHVDNDLGEKIVSVNISPTGKYIVVIRGDDTADIYTIKNGRATHVDNDLGEKIVSVNISPTGNYIVVIRGDDTANIYTIKNGKAIYVDNDLGEKIVSVTISQGGDYIAVVREDDTADIYTIDYKGKAILDDNDLGRNISHIILTEAYIRGKYIVVVRMDGTVDIYEVDYALFRHISQDGLDLIAYIYNNRDKKNRLNDEQYSAFRQLPEKIRRKLEPYVAFLNID